MNHDRTLGRILIGSIVLFLGIGFLFDAFGLLPFGSTLSEWWPVVIILFGLFRLLGPSDRNHVFSLVVIAFGFLLLLWRLGYVVVDVWSLIWPILLILVGIALLKGKHPITLSSTQSADDALALFSGTVKRVDNERYEGGNVTALFGAVKLDLRKATIENTAEVQVAAIFGGVDILVPENCQVRVNATPIFGAFDDKTEQVKNAKCTLVIKGDAIFGGVSIKN